MVLIEAMSSGLPVIVNTAAGAAAIVEPPPQLLVPPAPTGSARGCARRARRHHGRHRRRGESTTLRTALQRARRRRRSRGVVRRDDRCSTHWGGIDMTLRSFPWSRRILISDQAGRRGRRTRMLTGTSDWRRNVLDGFGAAAIVLAGSRPWPRAPNMVLAGTRWRRDRGAVGHDAPRHPSRRRRAAPPIGSSTPLAVVSPSGSNRRPGRRRETRTG